MRRAMLAVAICLAPLPSQAAWDPWEAVNRPVDGFNRALRREVLGPITEVYLRRTPPAVRQGIGRALANLGEPVTAASGLLAGETTLAWQAAARFGINTTLGWGGVQDRAVEWGYPPRRFDLGDTFCAWGLPAGPYVVLPVLGPATLRDAVAMVLTSAGLAVPLGADAVLALNGAAGFAGYAELHPELERLEAQALDPYASLRSAYAQRRGGACVETAEAGE